MGAKDAQSIMWVQTLVLWCAYCIYWDNKHLLFHTLHSVKHKSCLALLRRIQRQHNRYHVRLAWCGFVLLQNWDIFYQPCNTLPTVRNEVFPAPADHKSCGDLHELPSALLRNKLPAEIYFEPDNCGHVHKGVDAIQGPKQDKQCDVHPGNQFRPDCWPVHRSQICQGLTLQC